MDRNPRLCPACGQPTAFVRRADHYASLFFVPLFPVKKGELFLECTSCGAMSPLEPGGQGSPRPSRDVCASCGRALEPGFTFCPYCGAKR